MHRIVFGGVMVRIFFIVMLFFMSLFVPSAHAQFTLGGNGLSLVPNPQFPSPHTAVEVSIDDYNLETVGATISWYLNGVEQTGNKNERSLTLTAGDVGEKSTIRVTLIRNNAPSISATLTIVPVVIDIVLETDTYVPYFYRGRALPGGESLIRAIAVVHDGTKVPDSTYTYKWSIGNTVVSGGGVKGKDILEFIPPHYLTGGLSLEVFSNDGELIGKSAVPLTSVDPELHFYEYSPLRGLTEREIGSVHPLIGEEITVYGEPYFINARIDERDATLSWEINGEPTTSDTDAPHAITLRHMGGEGSADIGFSVVTKKQIPQFIEKTFRLVFE